MLRMAHLFRKSLCLILSLTILLAGCSGQSGEVDVSPGETKESTSASSSKNTISSAEYTYSPAIKFLDDDELLRSLGPQTFQLDCPTASSNDMVFVQLQLPEQWTQDNDTPTLFYFPDGSNAMQLEILPLEQGQCIWSAERLWEDESCISYSEKYIRFLYKGIIIKHNKTEPTYTKTSLFLCEERRFFMAWFWKGVALISN